MNIVINIDLGNAEVLVAGQRMTGAASVSLPVDAMALAIMIAGGPLPTPPAPLPPVTTEPDVLPVEIAVPVIEVPVIETPVPQVDAEPEGLTFDELADLAPMPEPVATLPTVAPSKKRKLAGVPDDVIRAAIVGADSVAAAAEALSVPGYIIVGEIKRLGYSGFKAIKKGRAGTDTGGTFPQGGGGANGSAGTGAPA